MATTYNWDEIAANPKFRELQQKKNAFLFGWWAFAATLYLLLLLGAGYAPNLFRIKVLGNINVCYLFALLQFLSSWGIAIYYARVANKDFDRLTAALVKEIG